MFKRKPLPGGDPLCLDIADNQLVAEPDGFILAFFLVADTNPVALLVVHQGGVHSIGETTPGEFHRCAHIHQGNVVEEKFAVLVGIWSGAHAWKTSSVVVIKAQV